MPLYDFKCRKCDYVFETITVSTRKVLACPKCSPGCIEGMPYEGQVVLADRAFPIPAGFRFPDMATLTKKRQRIKEPIWRYPDGSYEPVNP